MELTAIVGIACRFPGASDYNQFWHNLEKGINSISEIPPQRWEIEHYYSPNLQTPNKTISKWGGFIKGIDMFDAEFFRISRREAMIMDPQQRIMLELSWSCLEDAGYSPLDLSGSQVGVFIGACNYDYDQLQHKYENIEGHTATGTYTCIIPNRISHFFNFHGPSVPVDTACSSSLVALHQAVNAIKESECEMALVGGVNVLCTPTSYISFSQLGMLSPTGQCKTFDSEADGYVRGEGAGVILLKSLAKAIEDNDYIYGVIKGSAVNHGGKARTLTSPNVYAQAQVLISAYTKADVAPNTVSYIETHGTGTPLGDPIEINGLKRSFRQLYKKYELPASEKHSCGLGAVKTNIGHLEAAAGIAGVIKVLLAMKHRKLPKIVNFEQLNPRIDLEGSPFYIVNETQEWQQLKTEAGEGIPRRTGVSSFGFGGVNAHVVLEEAPVKVKSGSANERKVHLLTLSAQKEKALNELATCYQTHLESNPELELADVCYTANTGRSHFNHRLAVIATKPQELMKKLLQYQAGEEVVGLFSGQILSSRSDPKVAFLFTGQGSQYVNMGKQLYETQPTFREIVDKCDRILRTYLEYTILEVIYPQDEQSSSESLLDQTAYTQPALFVIEYALAKLWESWGIKANVVMGHSVGEYVAACVAGVFSLEDGLNLIAMRGKLMQQQPASGNMVSLLASESQVKEAIVDYTNQVAIAALNGPESVVISGVSEAVEEICTKLEGKGIKTKRLQVSHAFHSSLMKPMLTEFAEVANQITFYQPQIPVISNVTGTTADDSIATAKYWVEHVVQPVNFLESIKSLDKQDIKIFLEIGPKPVLLGMGRECLMGSKKLWFPSLRPGKSDWLQMLQSLGQLYVQGVDVKWKEFDRDYIRQKVMLPIYPWQQKRYWITDIQGRKNQDKMSQKDEGEHNVQNRHLLDKESKEDKILEESKLRLSNLGAWTLPKARLAEEKLPKRELNKLRDQLIEADIREVTQLKPVKFDQKRIIIKEEDRINKEGSKELKTMNRQQVENLKKEYEEKGYCQIKKIFDFSEIEKIQETLKQAREESEVSKEKVTLKLGKIDDIDTKDHAYDLVKHDFVASLLQKKLHLLNYITGKNLMIMHNGLFSVEPNQKGLPWHVGVGSFSFTKTEDFGASIWIPLDKITKEYRGGMQYVSTSIFPGQFYYTVHDLHLRNNIKWDESKGDLNEYVMNANTIFNKITEDVIDYTIQDGYEEDEYNVGDVLFFNKYVLHRSVPLKPGLHKLRRAFVIRLVDYDNRVDEERLGLFSKYSQLHSRFYKTLPRYNKDSVLVMVSRAVQRGLKSPYIRDIPYMKQTLSERMAVESISYDQTPSRSALNGFDDDIAQIKETLKQSLAEALYAELSEIEEDQKFIDLGLDSIVGVEWTTQINQTYNLNLKATKLYDYPTILDLAEYIAEILSNLGENYPVNQQKSPSPIKSRIQSKQDSGSSESSNKSLVNLLEVKQVLKQQLAEALYAEPSEIKENQKFIDLGLDSIVGVEWTTQINQTYNLNIKATKLYDYPTILDLAEYIAQEISSTGGGEFTQGNRDNSKEYLANRDSEGDMNKKMRLRSILNRVANNELSVQEANQLVQEIKKEV